VAGILRGSSLAGSRVQVADEPGGGRAADEALFVSSVVLERLGGPTIGVRVVPSEAGRGAGFVEPAAGVALAGERLPVLMKLGRANVTGFVGMTRLEPEVSGIDGLLRVGRWLRADDDNECVLPDRLARQLNVRDEDVEAGRATVYTFANAWKVVGLLDGARLQTFFDLDGGRISPLEPEREKAGDSRSEELRIQEQEAQAKASTELTEFKHLDPARVVFLPFDRLNELGGVIKSIAVGFADLPRGREEIRSFLERSNALVFLADRGQTRAMTSMGRTGVSGLGDLLVPILIGAFIIVNTMMGSV
jgi:hypothetical protein